MVQQEPGEICYVKGMCNDKANQITLILTQESGLTMRSETQNSSMVCRDIFGGGIQDEIRGLEKMQLFYSRG